MIWLSGGGDKLLSAQSYGRESTVAGLHGFELVTTEVSEKDHALSAIRRTNQLPSELLAKIFIIAEKMCRHARLTSDTYFGFQDTATQVCRYWRETAISTPELWTYIFISSPGPHEHAQLYLSRSGARLIHVDLVIRSSNTEGFESIAEGSQVVQMLEMVKSIFSGGGFLDRWSSFALFAGFPVVFSEAMEQINARPTPNLKFVSLQHEQLSSLDLLQPLATLDPSHTLKLGLHHPMLSSIQLRGLPHHFIFSHPKPPVPGLRRLGLAVDHALSSIRTLGTLLGACTQLESLSLVMSFARIPSQENPPIVPLFLPSLRFFSLDLAHSYAFGLCVLLMIDAPGVEIFQMRFEFKVGMDVPRFIVCGWGFGFSLRVGGAELARFISSRELSDTFQYTPTAGQPGAGPLFPSLRTLALPDLSCNEAIYADLLGAYAGVTKATLSTSGVTLLSHQDRFLPHLTHLRSPNNKDPTNMAAIKEAVQKRRDWGMQLSLLELVSTDPESEGWKTTEEIEKDFGSAILDGLVVRKIMDWRFGLLGVYDLEDCVPT